MAEHDASNAGGQDGGAQAPTEHLNIKVTDNNNEVFFKIKRTTTLKKLMDAFCDRQGKMPNSVRFLFDGDRVQPNDTPESKCKMETLWKYIKNKLVDEQLYAS